MNLVPLADKVVIVTGAGSGLGEAAARGFANEGARIACLDIREEAAERVCTEIVAGGRRAAISARCDVADERSIDAAVEHVLHHFGRVDVAINNAAIDHTVSVDDMSVAQWDRVIGVNLRGPFLMAKALLPHMKDQRSGHIVNVASTAATRAWANAAAYHASKWGLVGFSRALEYGAMPWHSRDHHHSGGNADAFLRSFRRSGNTNARFWRSSGSKQCGSRHVVRRSIATRVCSSGGYRDSADRDELAMISTRSTRAGIEGATPVSCLARAPLRVSFGGGGTDLPAYYRRYERLVLSVSINRFAFVFAATEDVPRGSRLPPTMALRPIRGLMARTIEVVPSACRRRPWPGPQPGGSSPMHAVSVCFWLPKSLPAPGLGRPAPWRTPSWRLYQASPR